MLRFGKLVGWCGRGVAAAGLTMVPLTMVTLTPACVERAEDSVVVAKDVVAAVDTFVDAQCECPEAFWGEGGECVEGDPALEEAAATCNDKLAATTAETGECLLALQRDLNTCAESCDVDRIELCLDKFLVDIAACPDPDGALGYCIYAYD